LLTDDDVISAFTEFPAPLVIVDRGGRGVRGNARFQDAFRIESLDPSPFIASGAGEDQGPEDIRLIARDGQSLRVRVRAVRTPRHVLLIVDAREPAADADELDRLRNRVGNLERLAATDHLTGVWNRTHLDHVIDSEIARSAAARQPLSMVLLDIDHFKNVNDTHGHAVGDIVLRELAGLIRRRVRASDALFRWGGEEFVVLVTGAGYRRAAAVAEGLRKAVEAHHFPVFGSLKVSAGVAEHDGDEDADAWFRRADAALYEAKQTGRNRVITANRGNSDRWSVPGGMALRLEWQEDFECGEPTIDAQHRELIRLANLLIDASMHEVERPGSVSLALAQLLAHVQRHFADEEAILERAGYAALEEHRRAHADLIRKALEMAKQLEDGKAAFGAIVEFLAQDVVARHMLGADRGFRSLFRVSNGH